MGDRGSATGAIRISDLFALHVLAKKSDRCNFRLLQQNRVKNGHGGVAHRNYAPPDVIKRARGNSLRLTLSSRLRSASDASRAVAAPINPGQVRRTLDATIIDTIFAVAPERARRADWVGVMESAAGFVAGFEG
jgi:hypothetical protein